MHTCLNAGAIGVSVSLNERIKLAKNAGFKAIDAGMQEIAAQVAERGAAEITDAMAEAGLSFGACGLPVRWNAGENEYKADLEDLPAYAAAAESVGATRICQWIPSASETMKFGENFDWHIARLRPIAAALKDHGCRLGLEFLGPRHFRADGKFGFICTAAGMLALCKALDTDNAGLLLDAFHWYTSGGTVADLMMLRNEDIVNVHINDAIAGVAPQEQIDNERALPGETNVIDLAGFLTALSETGYDGPVAAEPFSRRVRELPPEEAVAATYEAVSNVWGRAGLS